MFVPVCISTYLMFVNLFFSVACQKRSLLAKYRVTALNCEVYKSELFVRS